MAELKETIDEMLSDDYIDRFKAEYKQLVIRIDNLNDYIKHYKSYVKEIELYLMGKQLNAMIEYRNILELRAAIDKIDLS